ncbi:hypothetical protein OSC52_11985 [Clostridium pasteurianum]|uniref:hypothetical protein n=1 Tax=Clostridium pasteurianum TaxID=1501 RepID=UPI002260C8D3|nr:hypothetical protein [Clostridium pasteurianum]UZW12575.1 hypothetical protein OSC52_11985 [Clostridium pasteurianum]
MGIFVKIFRLDKRKKPEWNPDFLNDYKIDVMAETFPTNIKNNTHKFCHKNLSIGLGVTLKDGEKVKIISCEAIPLFNNKKSEEYVTRELNKRELATSK